MTSIFLFCFLLLFSSCLTLCDRDLTLCDRDSRFWGIKLPKYPSGPFSKPFEAHLTSSDLIFPEFNEISLLKVDTVDMFVSSSSHAALFLYLLRLILLLDSDNSPKISFMAVSCQMYILDHFSKSLVIFF